jgi:hypothetical protein
MDTLERDDLKKALKAQYVKKFTKSNLGEIRREIDKKLSILEDTYGIRVKLGKIKFGDVSFRANIIAEVIDTGTGMGAEQITWNRLCSRYGLLPADYGKTIELSSAGKFSGRKGIIFSINTRGKRYPILVKLDNGMVIKNTAISIQKMLGRA